MSDLRELEKGGKLEEGKREYKSHGDQKEQWKHEKGLQWPKQGR